MKTRCYRNECERVLNQFGGNASNRKETVMFRYLLLILFSNGPLGVPIRGKESRTRRMLVLVVGGQENDVVGKFRVGSISLVWDIRTLSNFALTSSLLPSSLPPSLPFFFSSFPMDLPPFLQSFLSIISNNYLLGLSIISILFYIFFLLLLTFQ